MPSGQHPIGKGAKRVQIGSLIEWRGTQRFGRHARGRTNDVEIDPEIRQRSKIDELAAPIACNADVAG